MKKLLLFLMSASVMLSSLTAVAEEYEEITVSEPEYDIIYPTGGLDFQMIPMEYVPKSDQSIQLFADESSETLYDYIDEKCRNHENYIELSSFDVTYREAADVFFQIAYVHPEYLVRTAFSWPDGSNYEDKAVMIGPIYLFEDKQKSENAWQEIESVVSGYLAGAEKYPDNIGKLLYLHDEMAKRCHYSSKDEKTNKYLPQAYHAYGIFMEETAVCQGYTQAYYILLNRLGFENRMCKSDAANHIWNQVKIDEKWYNIDVTHDDPIIKDEDDNVLEYTTAHHNNFLVSDNTLINNGGHAPDRSDWEAYGGTLTECTDTEFESKYMFNYSSPFTIGYSDNEFYFDAVLSNSETGNVYNVVFHSPKLRTPGIMLSYVFKFGTKDYLAAFPLQGTADNVKLYIAYFKDGRFGNFRSAVLGSCDRSTIITFPNGADGCDTKVFFWNNATQAPYSYVYNVK